MTTKPDALIELVESEIEDFELARNNNPTLFSPNLNLYPIPFFGDIRRAEVLTLALNPAEGEFRTDRNWPTGLTARGLTDRLLDYFDLRETEPHEWFDKRQPALSLLGRSYQCGAAHIDLLSHPTRFPNILDESQRTAFARLVGQSLERFEKLLRSCRVVKLILVIDYRFPIPSGGTAPTFDFLANLFAPFAKRINGNGDLPPIFRGDGVNNLTQRVRQHRLVLRDCLQGGRNLEF